MPDKDKISERLEQILDRLAVRMYDEGQLDKPSLMGRQVAIVNINEAHAKITQLLLEELENLPVMRLGVYIDGESKDIVLHDRILERKAELEAALKEN